MANDVKQEPPEDQQKDPVVDSTLSGPMLVFSALLFLSLVWALYDELFLERPWKYYQTVFTQLYTNYLKELGPQQASAEKQVRSSPEFQKIEGDLKAAEDRVAQRVTEIDEELRSIRTTLNVIKDPHQDARARIAAMIYELDHTLDDGGKSSIREDIEELKQGPYLLALNGTEEELTFDDLDSQFLELKARESQLNSERAEITAEARRMRGARNQYLADNLVGLSQQQIDGLIAKMEDFPIEIRQIHVEEAGLVDRCETCHLGIREPVTITAKDMRGVDLFVSHPSKELLAEHDPQEFGCSPCHNGNGLATSSATKAHGQYKHWLWPLFAKQHSEAGCLKCHVGDRVLEHAEVLNTGRDLFHLKGCAGCHRHEQFDREVDTLTAIQKEIQNLEMEKKNAHLEVDRSVAKGDAASSNEDAQRFYSTAEGLRVTASNIDAKIEELDRKAGHLMRDLKKLAPNLKDAKVKLRKEWIPVWLKDTQGFRPGTKMPQFRLTDEEIQALSAFLWQSALDGPAPDSQPQGNAENGKELFETRGCLACHSIGEGDLRMGGTFAANLSRVGEKANYDYIVRWVHDPRHRTQPYCPLEERDIGPEDYARHGLPFEFDLEDAKCPNDGRTLQVQNMTVMPSLRLSVAEARDIATYLMSQKHDDATYSTDVGFMDDTQLAERGLALTSRYGCGSCHEIKGLEQAPRIGTELTKESSKPMEQLDFGLLEHQAKHEGWYNHRGFYERKLANPAVFDQGREKAPEDLLRMPKIHLTEEDTRAIVTFLLGSVESPFHGEFNAIPEQYRYIPSDQQRDIQEGWWIVKKYNCMGCHDMRVGQKSVMSGLPRYQDPDWKEQLPPQLVQEGARVNPEWLAQFLANPAQSEAQVNRNGIRTYLHARMPTFNFSPGEIQTLVRFFEALAGQSSPYIPTRIEPLDNRERELARTLFSSDAAPCLKCHLVGDPRRDQFATAPNFLIAKERLKPGWTARWLLDPAAISPGTAMPSGLFRRDGERWVFSGPTPASFNNYQGDHVDLLVRYMFELTAAEQQRLLQRLPATASSGSRGSNVAMD